MRAVIQRVTRARVVVDQATTGSIGPGLLVLLGVEKGDSADDLKYVFGKTIGLRIFNDDHGKMNLSLDQVRGELLVVSQFTLLGDVSKGRRPSFVHAADPELAQRLYDDFISLGTASGIDVQSGIFQADMEVELVNDGPVTILIDSHKVF